MTLLRLLERVSRLFCNKCKVTHVRRSRDPETGTTTVSTWVTQGRVFVDRIFSEKRHIELFCIICGNRWMLDKEKNRFAAWLLTRELAHANAVTL